ncbi:hypothetical protein LOOC260_112830 [Paucilactobacillus hokkaidonensis JCM 18461]|uniref:Gram-positive cocci surface proteins LPxTG domain-containing protein n=2 Tax=Paucilactobacillus hokkaidonensis TaxID=1193095 RepID=A0A0A1GZC5_9LACO|nr:LPXTG cell wall anchor domain-containing protein [Paucilactobacillus hokkaidonensis]KRO10365.1 hypothetical protein IV59_GL001985 [Paucilactobacillus hokkaidonensis]BAP85821.1 hypothetical protein LOOC260_112830 [Paucilactobacillus hokkaidonensis JCM 18461]
MTTSKLTKTILVATMLLVGMAVGAGLDTKVVKADDMTATAMVQPEVTESSLVKTEKEVPVVAEQQVDQESEIVKSDNNNEDSTTVADSGSSRKTISNKANNSDSESSTTAIGKTDGKTKTSGSDSENKAVVSAASESTKDTNNKSADISKSTPVKVIESSEGKVELSPTKNAVVKPKTKAKVVEIKYDSKVLPKTDGQNNRSVVVTIGTLGLIVSGLLVYRFRKNI